MTDAPITSRHVPDWLILTIACIAQFMVVLDVSIVNVALPRMGQDLHLSINGAQWVVNAYVLTFAGFLLLGGRAADLWGRRNVYLVGMVLFTVTSIAAGVSHNGTEMIVARAIQGLGGAILSPATLTIVVTSFRGPKLPKALGAWSAVAGAGGAVGGLLGGILTGVASWRWVFFINVPIGIVAMFLAVAFLQELRRPDADARLDVTGSVLVTGGLAAAIYGIVDTITYPWSSGHTIGWLASGLVLLALFVLWEARVASHPLVPFRIFRSRSLSTANAVMLLAGGVFFAMWYFVTYYFQYVLGYGPVKAGFAFFPMALGIVVGAQLSSRVLHRTGAALCVRVGALIAAVGFWGLSTLGVSSSYGGAIIYPAVGTAFAMGLLFAPLASAATAGVSQAEAGLASGLLNTSRQVGGCLALAALATVATDRTNSLLALGVHRGVAYVDGYHRVFEISALVAVIALVASFALPAAVGRHAPAPTPAAETA